MSKATWSEVRTLARGAPSFAGARPSLSATWLALIAAPIVGSFLSVLVVRLPAGEGVVGGRSRCRSCGSDLSPLELLPLLSWALLRGRCRSCGAPIGILYPAIEIAAVAVVAWTAATVPEDMLWPTAGLGWSLLALAVIDARTFILPDALTLPLIAAGLAVAWYLDPAPPLDHVVGAAAGGLSFWLIAHLYARTRHRQGLGLGDAKLFAAAGAWVSWQGLASVLLTASLGALALVALLAAFGGPARASTRVPFGPFLALGLWLTWLYGPIALAR